MNWLKIIRAIVPIIVASKHPELSAVITNISDGINQAESMKGSSGPEKLDSAIRITNDAAELIKMKVDNNKVKNTIDTAVSIANLLSKNN